MFKVDTRNLHKKLITVDKTIYAETNKAVTKIGNDGANKMKQIIRNSGTDFSNFRSMLGVGSKGRVRTGAMINSVGYSKQKTSSAVTLFQIGFIKSVPQKYFMLQEKGFRNVWKFASYGFGTFGPNAPEGFTFTRATRPKRTQGMFAMRDTLRFLKAEKKNYTSSIKNGVADKLKGR
jgi:hypothetical protein